MTSFSISETVPVAKQADGSFHFSLHSIAAKLKQLEPKLPLFCKYETLFNEAIRQVTGQQLMVEWRTTMKISEQENELIFFQTIHIPELTNRDHMAKATEIVNLILSKSADEYEDNIEHKSCSGPGIDESTQVSQENRESPSTTQKTLELEDSSRQDLPEDYVKILEAVESSADEKFKEIQEKLPQNKGKSTILSVIPSHTVIVNHTTNSSSSNLTSEKRQPFECKKIERENVVEQVTIHGALIGTDWVRRPPTTRSNRRSKITIECKITKSETQASFEQIDTRALDEFEEVTVLVPHTLEITGECDLLKESFPQQYRDQGSARKIAVIAEKSSCSGELVLIRVLQVEQT